MKTLTDEKLTIVGAAGMIGSNMAQTAIMMGLTSNICLYDPYAPGLEGVAEELFHCGFEGVNITFTSDIKEALTGAKYIVNSGGAARKAGMTREDLLKGNAAIAEEFGKNVKAYCPDVKHIVVIFNPADITGLITLLYSGLKPSQVTTLARILTGLNKAQGNFYIGDQKVGDEGLMPFSGLVLQNADHQLQMRTVAEEVEGAIVAGRVGASKAKGWRRLAAMRPRPEDRARVQEILTSLNLLALAERHPQSLSGGEKQRLVIACAVAKDPAILILDEPTSGLDGANMAAIARLMREQADAGRAVFLVTHDLELLESCDRALVMTDLQKKCAG